MIFNCNTILASTIKEPKKHNNWTSYIVENYEMTLVRICTIGTEKTSLCIDFAPNGEMFFEIFAPAPLSNVESTEIQLSGAMRIDKRPVEACSFMYRASVGTNYLTLAIRDISIKKFADQAVVGNTVRFKIDSLEAGAKDFYFRYSLLGFSAAFNRALDLARLLWKRPSPSPLPFKRNDSGDVVHL